MEANEKILKQAYEIGELKEENTQLKKKIARLSEIKKELLTLLTLKKIQIRELQEDKERMEDRIRNLSNEVNLMLPFQ